MNVYILCMYIYTYAYVYAPVNKHTYACTYTCTSTYTSICISIQLSIYDRYLPIHIYIYICIYVCRQANNTKATHDVDPGHYVRGLAGCCSSKTFGLLEARAWPGRFWYREASRSRSVIIILTTAGNNNSNFKATQ